MKNQCVVVVAVVVVTLLAAAALSHAEMLRVRFTDQAQYIQDTDALRRYFWNGGLTRRLDTKPLKVAPVCAGINGGEPTVYLLVNPLFRWRYTWQPGPAVSQEMYVLGLRSGTKEHYFHITPDWVHPDIQLSDMMLAMELAWNLHHVILNEDGTVSDGSYQSLGLPVGNKKALAARLVDAADICADIELIYHWHLACKRNAPCALNPNVQPALRKLIIATIEATRIDALRVKVINALGHGPVGSDVLVDETYKWESKSLGSIPATNFADAALLKMWKDAKKALADPATQCTEEMHKTLPKAWDLIIQRLRASHHDCRVAFLQTQLGQQIANALNFPPIGGALHPFLE